MSDDPGNVLFLRLAMLGLVFVIALAAFAVNRREGVVAAIAAPAILFTITPFAIRATEIRHDTLAFACFLSGLAVLSLDWPSPRVRGAAAGVLLALAAWSSQKALLYGLPAGVLLVVETVRSRRGGPSAFGSVGAAWAGRRSGRSSRCPLPHRDGFVERVPDVLLRVGLPVADRIPGILLPPGARSGRGRVCRRLPPRGGRCCRFGGGVEAPRKGDLRSGRPPHRVFREQPCVLPRVEGSLTTTT